MKLLASVLQVGGLAVLVVGVSLFSLPAGLITGGVALVLVGFALGMSK
jgi:hypothetical protein